MVQLLNTLKTSLTDIYSHTFSAIGVQAKWLQASS